MDIVSINEVMYIKETLLFVPYVTCPWPILSCVHHRQHVTLITAHMKHQPRSLLLWYSNPDNPSKAARECVNVHGQI